MELIYMISNVSTYISSYNKGTVQHNSYIMDGKGKTFKISIPGSLRPGILFIQQVEKLFEITTSEAV